jgi:hypothetical protein
MEWVYITKIIDIKPSTLDEGDDDCIVDAYIKVRANEITIWCFVPHWRTYFPYNNRRLPHHPYGIGETLVKNLIDKTINSTFRFLNLKTELSGEKTKKIIPLPKRKKPCDYVILGEVINKEPFPREPDRFEYLQIDCGFIVNSLDADKGVYNIGDYIRAEGRLDVYLVDEEKLAKARRDSVVRGER